MSPLRAMRSLHLAAAAFTLVALVAAGPATAASTPDPETQRLAAELAALDADPSLADLAGLERLKARQALARLQAAKSRDRAHAAAVAGRWIEAASVAANAALLEQQGAQLDRERDEIMVEASRRAAERARRDADLLRLQTLVREEEAETLAQTQSAATAAATAEAEKANAQAAQANRLAAARAHEVELARKEAELAAAVAGDGPAGPSSAPPSRRVGGTTVYTLDGDAFPSGSAQLTARATASLNALAAAVPRASSLMIRGYTDSQGGDEDNRLLSQRRADAVRRALAAAGIAASRLRAEGKGEADPVADNGSEAGRARNRRVEITVK